ncbi:hypothetical protein [uncultured Nocardioides sp.]|uniref:hypothetical protein n=1 Tax=uncultured Nocardioides sp. TaxID=198441 RepID=UPI00262FBA2E|nr:hypothetical protein [uncultured Nocardioides sp.]
MVSRTLRAGIEGAGSMMDIGGTGYRRHLNRTLKLRNPVSDQRNLAKDFRIAIVTVVDKGAKRR